MLNNRSRIWLCKDVATPYFLSQLLTTIGLSIPHAILTPLLLGKGILLSQILIMQAAFSLSVLLFEFPSGAIADIFSRRWIYIFSRLVLCVFFLVVIFGHGFPLLLFSWVIYGLASALDSGTLDAALVNNAKNNSKPVNVTEHRISWLVRKESQSKLLGMMIGSTVGAVLFTVIEVNIYFISLAMAIFSILSIVFFFHIPEQHARVGSSVQGPLREMKKHIRLTFKEMRQSPALKKYLLLLIIAQSFMQLHFQLWQSVALEKGFSNGSLIYLYLSFMAMSYLSAYIPFEIVFNKNILIIMATLLLASFGVCSYVIAGRSYAIFYGLAVFVLIALSNYSSYGIRKSSSVERIGAITSLTSVCGRIGAVSTLVLASIFIQAFSSSAVLTVGFTLLTVFTVTWVVVSERGWIARG